MNVILTAVGSMSALCAIKYLQKAGNKVIGCDIYPKEWHYEASLCDEFEQSPYVAHHKEYVDFLLQLARKYDVSYIMPLTDLEIDVLNLYRESFEQNGIILCISSKETLAIVRNKYVLANVFWNDSNVPSINTVRGDNVENMRCPCVAKPYNGRSSEGLKFINAFSELGEIENIEDYIFQEKIEGSVCTVDYVRDPNTNESFCVSREELLRTKNGAGTTVKIFNDSTLSNLVKYIGDKLNIKGVVNMEFINNNGCYYLIDINPRFSAGVAFSCKTGYDFIDAHLSVFSDKSIPAPVEYEDKIEIKYFIEA